MDLGSKTALWKFYFGMLLIDSSGRMLRSCSWDTHLGGGGCLGEPKPLISWRYNFCMEQPRRGVTNNFNCQKNLTHKWNFRFRNLIYIQFPPNLVVVVVVRYATPLPMLRARFASDFANADFAKDDWVMGDGKEKFCSDGFPKITNAFPRLRYSFELGGTGDIQSPRENAICNFLLYGQRQLP